MKSMDLIKFFEARNCVVVNEKQTIEEKLREFLSDVFCNAI